MDPAKIGALSRPLVVSGQEDRDPIKGEDYVCKREIHDESASLSTAPDRATPDRPQSRPTPRRSVNTRTPTESGSELVRR